MNWKLVYLPEAAKDLKDLAGNQRLMVVKAMHYLIFFGMRLRWNA